MHIDKSEVYLIIDYFSGNDNLGRTADSIIVVTLHSKRY